MPQQKNWDHVREVGDDMVHLSVVADMLEALGYLKKNEPKEVLGETVDSWTVTKPDGTEATSSTRLDAAEDFISPFAADWYLARAQSAGYRPLWLEEGEELTAGFHVDERIDPLNTLRRGAAELDLAFTLADISLESQDFLTGAIEAIGDACRETARELHCLPAVETPGPEALKRRHSWIVRMAEEAQALVEEATRIANGEVPAGLFSDRDLRVTYRLIEVSRKVLQLSTRLLDIRRTRQES